MRIGRIHRLVWVPPELPVRLSGWAVAGPHPSDFERAVAGTTSKENTVYVASASLSSVEVEDSVRASVDGVVVTVTWPDANEQEFDLDAIFTGIR